MLHMKHMSAASGSMTALLQNLTNSHYHGYESDELLSSATASLGHIGPKLFDTFFVHVRRVTLNELGF